MMLKARIGGWHKSLRKSLMVYFIFVKILHVRAKINSCPISPLTVEIVDECPDTYDKWREAAARKNCAAVASQCDEPEKLVYHCVINAYVNQTLEVCAYMKIIVLGHCAEYNFGGNRIQQNYKTDCSIFTQRPCPQGYKSTDAYKYPGCYELTKIPTGGPAAITTPSTINKKSDKQADRESSIDILPVIAVVVFVLVVVLGIYLILIRIKEKCSFFRTKDPKEELLPLRVTVDTETEDIHVAPSGQIIGNGIKKRKIMIVNEEILPEHYLKPEEDPKGDCQTLLNRISDGLTGIAIIHSENSNADIQLNLANLHNEYDNPGLSFSQESRHTFEDDLAQVESLIEYFKKQRNKQRSDRFVNQL